MKKILSAALCFGCAAMLFSGCGPSPKAIAKIDARIKLLTTGGAPDSLVTPPSLCLQMAKDAMARKPQDTRTASIALDSANILLKQIEAGYTAEMARLKPGVVQQVAGLRTEAAELTGLHKKKADSALTVVDSAISANALFLAEAKGFSADTVIKNMIAAQKVADGLRPQVIGKWTCINKSKSIENPAINAVEQKVFTFGADGKVYLEESKKGQSAANLKEDWAFFSWGTYDLRGDTVLLAVTRFKIAKQDFVEMKEGKWVVRHGVTCDSAITDGSQNRSITFPDLKLDFVKK